MQRRSGNGKPPATPCSWRIAGGCTGGPSASVLEVLLAGDDVGAVGALGARAKQLERRDEALGRLLAERIVTVAHRGDHLGGRLRACLEDRIGELVRLDPVLLDERPQ